MEAGARRAARCWPDRGGSRRRAARSRRARLSHRDSRHHDRAGRRNRRRVRGLGRRVVVDRGRAGPGRRRGVVCAVRRRWPQALLLAVLALSALLAPADQARISDHDVAGQARRFRRLVRRDRGRLPAQPAVQAAGRAGGGAGRPDPDDRGGHGPGARHDRLARRRRAGQGRPADDGHGGHFLVETTDVLQYYLPNTTWQQWSDTASNSPQYYLQRIRQHYYAVIVLGFNQTLSTDYAIALELSADQRVHAGVEGALGNDGVLRVGVHRAGVTR